MEYVFYAAAAMLGAVVRYNLGLTQATKAIGTAISDTDTKTGFQDAITPPSSTNLTLATWAVTAAVFVYGAYKFGWAALGIALVVFFLVSVIAGAVLIPKPESAHFIRRIYKSMVNRHTAFKEAGHSTRAVAMKELIDRIEAHYGNKLTA